MKCKHKKTCPDAKLCVGLNYCPIYICAENFREMENYKEAYKEVWQH